MAKFRKDFSKRATSEKFNNKEKTMKGKILNIARKIGIALGITGTVATTAVYADMKYNDAEISKGIIKMFSGDKPTDKATVPQGTFEQKNENLISQQTKKSLDQNPEPTKGGGEPDDDERVNSASGNNDKAITETNKDKVDGDNIPPTSHKELLAKNEKYQKNYEIAQNFSRNGANGVCTKIAGQEKLSNNDSKVYLITTYYGFTKNPQLFTTKTKKSFLGLYFNDVSWNNASAGDINTKFAKLMKDARTFLRNGDAGELSMPRTKEQAQQEKKVDDAMAKNVVW